MMPQKKDLKLIRSLSQKKFRQETGLFVVEGKKMVEEAILSDWELEVVFSTDPEFVATQPGAVQLTAKEMEQLSGLSTPSPYLAVLQQRGQRMPEKLHPRILLLDGISDPGNMGTIIRTAEWFGIKMIICSENAVELYNPKVVQATMGSIFRVEVYYADIVKFITGIKTSGYTVIGADLNGVNLFEYPFASKTELAVVIGSESHGISAPVRSLLDAAVTIPGGGGAESLNASVAAAIVMAEMGR